MFRWQKIWSVKILVTDPKFSHFLPTKFWKSSHFLPTKIWILIKFYLSFGNAFHCKTRTYSGNITITAEVKKQLRDGVSPADIKISLRLTRINELHAKRIHDHMRKRLEVITNGFEAAGINEACVNVCIYVTRVQNPFCSEECVEA